MAGGTRRALLLADLKVISSWLASIWIGRASRAEISNGTGAPLTTGAIMTSRAVANTSWVGGSFRTIASVNTKLRRAQALKRRFVHRLAGAAKLAGATRNRSAKVEPGRTVGKGPIGNGQVELILQTQTNIV